MYLQIVSLVGGRHLRSVYLTSVTAAECVEVARWKLENWFKSSGASNAASHSNLATMKGVTLPAICCSVRWFSASVCVWNILYIDKDWNGNMAIIQDFYLFQNRCERCLRRYRTDVICLFNLVKHFVPSVSTQKPKFTVLISHLNPD